MFLSIIIPVYNAAKTISRSLDSIWSQNLPQEEYEVICVNDCSPDDSVVVIQQQMACHANLKLLHNPENLRAGGARNHGVKEAQGDYISFIDADDYYHPGGLAHACALLKQENLDILVCNFVRELPGTTGKELVHHYASQETMEPEEYRKANGFIPYGPCQWLFRRSLMTGAQLWFTEKVSAEDVDWTHRLVLGAKRMRYAPICLTHYVLHEQSQTGSAGMSSNTVYHLLMASKRLLSVAPLWEKTENQQYVRSVASAYACNGLKYYLLCRDKISRKADYIRQWISPDLHLPGIYHFMRQFPIGYVALSNFLSPFVTSLNKCRKKFVSRGIRK